jgi:nicotinate-nucleotide adenylyltransferase
MRYALYGGAYNPPHIAHLYMAEVLVKEYGYDRVLFIPSNISSHKSTAELLHPNHRLAMLELLEKEISWMEVSGCEIRRGGISYSIDTVEELSDRINFKEKPGLLIGDDLLADFTSWKRVDELISLVDLIVAFRTGREKISCPYPFTRLENKQLSISSSDIRTRIRENRAFRFMLSPPVYEYIVEKGLYV